MERAIPLLAVALVLVLTGCLISREISSTTREIARANPDIRLERQIVLNLGPMSVRTARWLASFAPESEHVDMALRYLDDIRRVKIGIYKAELVAGRGDRSFDPTYAFEKDWQVAVRVREADENVWVLYRDDDRQLRDLYVVVLTDEDLVLARVHGRLERLAAEIIKDHGHLGELVRDSVDTVAGAR